MRGTGKGRVYPRGRQWWIGYYGPNPKPGIEWGEIREPGMAPMCSGCAVLSKPELLMVDCRCQAPAKKRLRERVVAVNADQQGYRRFHGPNQEKILFGDLLTALEAEYKTKEAKSERQLFGEIARVRARFGHFRAVALTSDRIREYVTERHEAGKANATINRATEIIARAFRLAQAEGKIGYVPRIVALPEHNARQGFFEKADFDAMLAQLAQPYHDFALLLYFVGWRRGEVFGLTWDMVDRANGLIGIPDSKNGDPRLVPMTDAVRELVERRWQAREFRDHLAQPRLAQFVFHREHDDLPLASSTLWKAVAKACVATGLGTFEKPELRRGYRGKLLHDLRRTAVRDMIRAGVPQAVAMSISGHRTTAIFQRYNISDVRDKLEALRLREAYAEKQPAASNVVAMRKG